jgi:hypothetical protein
MKLKDDDAPVVRGSAPGAAIGAFLNAVGASTSAFGFHIKYQRYLEQRRRNDDEGRVQELQSDSTPQLDGTPRRAHMVSFYCNAVVRVQLPTYVTSQIYTAEYRAMHALNEIQDSIEVPTFEPSLSAPMQIT